MNDTRITTTCTRDCPNTCGLIATVSHGKIIRMTGSPDHPLTKGATCRKTMKYIDRVYHPDRIIYPMIRRNGNWTRVSWDDALDRIADRMTQIRSEDGPESILYYQGYGERTALKLLNSYFFNLFGGVTTLTGSLCGGTGQASQNLDFGTRISHDPLDHLNSRAMILWARNPASTNISLVPIVKEIQRNKGKVITIDPFRNRSASLADHHISPAPGRDVYLAMAAAKRIIARGQADQAFMDHHSEGYPGYRAILDRHSFSECCALAGVAEADAIYLADLLITHRPASILLGWGLHRHRDAHYSIRAIDALAAIAGNIGKTGGGVSQGFEEYGPYDPRYWGEDLHPGHRKLLLPRIGREILAAANPKIRMIFVTAANPICMVPNTAMIMEAFRRMEFVVYCGHFLDDTADLADVFLPAATFLEEDDVMASYGHNYVGPVNKAIEPLGECLSNFDMFSRLAQRFSFAGDFCRSAQDWLFDICAPIRDQGCDLETLKKGPFRLSAPMVPYENRKFPTPSGKFQFMTDFDESRLIGHDPGYPYTLLTVAPHGFICSERTLAEHTPFPVVGLHPDEASRQGLTEGDSVMVESPQGRVRATLHLDAGLRPDCLVAERGGWMKAGHGLNRLTRDEVSTVGNGTPYYETRVRVMALERDI